MKKEKTHILNQGQYIALGFFMVIAIGTVLLMLPWATREGQSTSLINAILTSTSAGCVTGLVAYDTYQHWTLFGQLVILLLIQIGGLGFISFGVSFSLLFQKKIGLRQRDLLKESVNAMELGGILKLLKEITIGTVLFEGIGAIALSTRFIPEFGVVKGIYFSIFHSISAFCNGGFDLMGTKAEFSSVVDYVGDPVVNITFVLLILIGGLGFGVWHDLKKKGFHWHRYTLHTKIVLVTSAILVVGGTLLLFIFENANTLAGMSASEKFFASLFGSVTARTAGFNSVDTGALAPESKLLTIILMFIGGCPGSTAGGIKVTTIAVIVVYVYSSIRNSSGCNMFKRRIGDEVIKKASLVLGLNLILAIISTLIITATSNLAMDDVLFETFSAISTVGMTTGITRDLNLVGRIVISLLMFCGRVGSMSFALSLIQKPSTNPLKYPEEKITIG